jgi:hypothetical protein
MTRCVPPAVDVRKVIQRFGGVPAIVAASDTAGFDMTTAQIRKWVERGIVPMQRWLELKAIAAQAGWNLALEDFIAPAACPVLTPSPNQNGAGP